MWLPALTLKRSDGNEPMARLNKTKCNDTYIRGKIRDQELLSILHSEGTNFVEKPMTVITHRIEITSDSQKRLRIFGTSIQKLDRSTSFFVAPQMILYEKRWARIACEMWIDNPPKKTKLNETVSVPILRATNDSGQNVQERNPGKVLEESSKQVTMSKAVLQE